MALGPFLTAGGREDYWRTRFPWELVWSSLASDKDRPPRVGHAWVNATAGQGMTRRATYAHAADWRHRVASGSTTSVHAVPPPDRYLVMDYDVRQDPRVPVCVAAGNHSNRVLCHDCWMSHVVPAVQALDTHVRQPLGLGHDSGLYVYSGGGGLHVWYHLANLSAHHARILREQPLIRKVLLTSWLPKGCGVTLVLDDAVTTGACHDDLGAHQLRLPFSLHDATGRPALPLGRDPATGTIQSPFISASDEDEDGNFIRGLALYQAWLESVAQGRPMVLQ